MSKLSVLVILALFLGGAGTGMGGLLIYQFAAGALAGEDGLPGNDGTDGTTGPLQLNGIYEGDHLWGDSVVPAGESVILRDGNFYGSGIYVYGNLTLENVVINQKIWFLGNSTTILNNTRWLGEWSQNSVGSTFSLIASENSSVFFINTFGFFEQVDFRIYFTLIVRGNSNIYFINCKNPIVPAGKYNTETYIYAEDNSRIHFENISDQNNPYFLELRAYETTSVFIRNANISFALFQRFFDNSTLYAWKSTFYSWIALYNNASLQAWNTTFGEVTLEQFSRSSAIIQLNSTIQTLHTQANSTATIRTNSTIDTLNAYQNSTIYLYQSESCTINTQNLFDAAQVITL